MSLTRRIKRKRKLKFMKNYRRSMKNFRKNVKCSECGVNPPPGEKIDQWTLVKKEEEISLVCVDCKPQEEEENEDSPEMSVL
jgi:transcription elongation factor Elf1